MLRSQTLIASPTSSFKGPSAERTDSIGRRPSLYDIQQGPPTNISADSAFIRQVDKLVDLLPHADRNVLAGYLMRSGQDVLAIGQYLEDEKNGTIKV